MRETTKTIMLGTMGVQLPNDSHWGRRIAFTQPRSYTKVIQAAQASLAQPRIKSAQRSPLYSPLLCDNEEAKDEEESQPVPQVDDQEPQSEQRSQDEFEVIVQEESFVVPQSGKGTAVDKKLSGVLQSEEGTRQSSHQVQVLDLKAPTYQGQSSAPTHISQVPTEKVNLRWCVKGLLMIFDRDSHVLKNEQPKRSFMRSAD